MKTEGKWSGDREMEKIEASGRKRGHMSVKPYIQTIERRQGQKEGSR